MPSRRRAVHGDLSENAEYHAARERQSFIEGRVIELEEIISGAEVIDPATLTGDQVKFGAPGEADRRGDRQGSQLSDRRRARGRHQTGGCSRVSSPLAKALIGKKPGDTVAVPAPGGDRSYEILSVAFG